MKVLNPVTEEAIEIQELSEVSLETRLKELKRSAWKEQSLDYRIAALEKVIASLTNQKESFAAVISNEMGKPLNLATVEVDRSIAEAKYFLENATSYLAKHTAPDGYVVYQPLGLVAVISPWNFPVMLPMRAIIPALIAGNSVVFKPSELTTRTGEALSKLFLDSDLLGSFFCAVGGKDLGKAIVQSEVKLIAFTGSTAAGKHIFRSAADGVKKLVLELGGLDAAIVLPDVDIKKTAQLVLRGNTANSGQVCNSIKRVYVDQQIYQEFLAEIVQLSKQVSVGDPSQNPDMGPLVSLEQLNAIQAFVDDAKQKGGTVHTGGSRLDRKGFFYPSTILSSLKSEMRILNEECFGPVLPVVPVENWQQAVELANDTTYGLAASVWTNDLDLAQTIALKLEVGGVHINTALAGGPGTPWGGCKQSGIGRQKTKESLLEFCNTKYIKV